MKSTGRWPLAITTWPQKAPTPWQDGAQMLLDPVGFAGPTRASADSILESAAGVDLDAKLTRLEDGWESWLAEEVEGEVSWATDEMRRWFDPSSDQPTAMVFLPRPEPWASLAYESWFAEGPELPATVLVALLERWHEEYGAEPMAHWGTMLQLRVTRPPTDIDRARALAREHLLVAPCTALLPGIHPEMHARALMQATTWFLHERP